jgi:hypothetical protein
MGSDVKLWCVLSPVWSKEVYEQNTKDRVRFKEVKIDEQRIYLRQTYKTIWNNVCTPLLETNLKLKYQPF